MSLPPAPHLDAIEEAIWCFEDSGERASLIELSRECYIAAMREASVAAPFAGDPYAPPETLFGLPFEVKGLGGASHRVS
jgi:hypothetical protein